MKRSESTHTTAGQSYAATWFKIFLSLTDKRLIGLKSLGGLPLISKEPRSHPKGLAHGGQRLWMSLFTQQSAWVRLLLLMLSSSTFTLWFLFTAAVSNSDAVWVQQCKNNASSHWHCISWTHNNLLSVSINTLAFFFFFSFLGLSTT